MEVISGAQEAFLLAIMVLLCIGTIAGNLLVIISVINFKRLRTVNNFLIGSLGVADLIVGLVVMPTHIIYKAFQYKWPLGLLACDLWHAIDILACTVSIWNLTAISIDRYLAVRDPLTYTSVVSFRRAKIVILMLWVISALISIPAIAWWRSESPHLYADPAVCLFTDSPSYLCFSSLVSFFIPFFIMLIAYCRVFRAAAAYERSLKEGRKAIKGVENAVMRVHKGPTQSSPHIHRLGTHAASEQCVFLARRHETNACYVQRKRSPSLAVGNQLDLAATRSVFCRQRHFSTDANIPSGPEQLKTTYGSCNSCESCQAIINSMRSTSKPPQVLLNMNMVYGPLVSTWGSSPTPSSRNATLMAATLAGPMVKKHALQRKVAQFNKEKKAAITLGIVVGCFIICWLPFFVVNILMGFCPDCIPSDGIVFTLVTWLGYCNSALNPIIYACYNLEFRSAFRNILTTSLSCGQRRSNPLSFSNPANNASFSPSPRYSRERINRIGIKQSSGSSDS